MTILTRREVQDHWLGLGYTHVATLAGPIPIRQWLEPREHGPNFDNCRLSCARTSGRRRRRGSEVSRQRELLPRQLAASQSASVTPSFNRKGALPWAARESPRHMASRLPSTTRLKLTAATSPSTAKRSMPSAAR